ncbi:universal stress protein [Luminiphilus sp. nBUS_16]|uniref:universal stress protein n=1 Tax=Luminiphilus sp. nBUS_16 TaxID=3395315 RepID=UPI003EC06A6D
MEKQEDQVIGSVDGSVGSLAVCEAAAWVASRLNRDLLLLHTLERRQQHGADDWSGAIGLGAQSELLERMAQLDQERGRLAMQYGKTLLQEAESRALAHGAGQVETLLRHGDFVEALVELEAQARLMVVGKVGTDHAGEFTALGSHIESLIRQVHTSILITGAQFTAPQSFMLAYDGRDTAERSLDRIIKGGLLTGLPCHLVMVGHHDDAHTDKFEAAASRLSNEGYHVTSSLVDGGVTDSLLNYQREHDIGLLIMGAFAHSKVRHLFLGSNTIRMIQSSLSPLIVLR